MPAPAHDLTPREVAELAGVPKRVVEKAIEEKVLAVRPGRLKGLRFGKAADARRLLGAESVAYVAFIRHLGGRQVLDLAAKRSLARALKGRGLAAMKSKVELAPAIVADVGALAGAELDRTARYLAAREAWIDSVDGSKGGLPIIKGTRISVHSIDARLKAGDRLETIVAENPDLPAEAFEAAAVFARAHPLPGRPTGLPRRAA